MTPEQVTQSITALRSGNYLQTRFHIKNDDDSRHCCIGVMAKECLGTVPTTTGMAVSALGLDIKLNEDHIKYLKDRKIDRVGIADGLAGTLIILNDAHKWTFEQIADFLAFFYKEQLVDA